MPSMTPAEAYALFFGRPPTPETLDLLRQRGRDYPIVTLTDARRLLMALDRAGHPTQALLRFGPEDLHTIELQGFTLVVDVADLAVSNHLVASRVWEPGLTGVFRRYLRPGHHVADIGANVGYFTMLARTLVGPGGHVHAFDANPENVRLLLLSLARNGFGNVSLYPLALSDRPGHAVFTSGIGSNGKLLGSEQEALASGGATVVPTMRLDDLVQGPLDFVKMDTEGAEYRIARGAARLLSTFHPIVSTEFSPRMMADASGADPRAHLALFLSRGYTVHRLDPATERLDAVPDIDAYLAGWGDPERIDDLLLLPAGVPVLQP